MWTWKDSQWGEGKEDCSERRWGNVNKPKPPTKRLTVVSHRLSVPRCPVKWERRPNPCLQNPGVPRAWPGVALSQLSLGNLTVALWGEHDFQDSVTRRLAKMRVQSRLGKAPGSRRKEDARQGRRKTMYSVFKSLYNRRLILILWMTGSSWCCVPFYRCERMAERIAASSSSHRTPLDHKDRGILGTRGWWIPQNSPGAIIREARAFALSEGMWRGHDLPSSLQGLV